MTEIEKSLHRLAEEINAEHRAFVGGFRKTVEHGIRAGELLSDAKKQCEHGTWLPWLEKNCEVSARTAQEYMRLYNHRDALRANTRDSAHLSVSGALKELAAPSSTEPFYEVLAFIEREGRRLAEVAAPERALPPSSASDGLKKLYASEEKMARGLQGLGKAYLDLASTAREIWEEHDHGRAAGWLRECLISMSHGPYGHVYRLALREVRERLSDAVADEKLRERIGSRLNEGTVTVDLTDMERALIKELDPALLETVEEAWEEDKDYELALRKMETFTRPIDVPPSRESGWLDDSLTDEHMHSIQERSDPRMDALREEFDQAMSLGGVEGRVRAMAIERVCQRKEITLRRW
jgi:hypothetical protein